MFGKGQFLTVKIGEHIFTSKPKILYQSFASSSELFVYRNGIWYPATINAIEEQHTMYRVTTMNDRILEVTGNHIVQTSDEKAHYVQDLRLNQSLMVEKSMCDKITSSESGSDQIKDIQIITSDDHWVFYVKMLSNQVPFFALSNGLISRAEL